MSSKIKKGVPLIDQHDKSFMYGGKFGGNFIPETLKKPIDDLTKIFSKLRKDKKFLKERDFHFKNYIGTPTPFIKLEKLTDYLGGAQIYAKVVSEANGGAHKIYNATVHCLIARKLVFERLWGYQAQVTQEKCYLWLLKVWSQM